MRNRRRKGDADQQDWYSDFIGATRLEKQRDCVDAGFRSCAPRQGRAQSPRARRRSSKEGARQTAAAFVGAGLGLVATVAGAIISPVGLVAAATVGLAGYFIYTSGAAGARLRSAPPKQKESEQCT